MTDLGLDSGCRKSSGGSGGDAGNSVALGSAVFSGCLGLSFLLLLHSLPLLLLLLPAFGRRFRLFRFILRLGLCGCCVFLVLESQQKTQQGWGKRSQKWREGLGHSKNWTHHANHRRALYR